MPPLDLDPELAERNRTLFLLDARIAAARVELAFLHGLGTDGERRTVSRHETRLLDANEHLVLSAIDSRASAERVAKLNQRDALTGLPNRALTLDRLETALAAARRNARTLGVVFIDLDALKSINDTQGHAAGDRALQAAARRLTASVRESDTVGRLGGDEFLAILPDIEGPGHAALVAAKMVSALALPASGADDAPPLTASIGIAIHPDDALGGAELIALADQAMYRAKARGRGLIEFHQGRDAGREAVVPAGAPREAHPGRLRDANERLVLASLDAQASQVEAAQIQRRQMTFLAMVAHELRNPLNPIITSAELLKHAATNSSVLPKVQEILARQVAHLARIVDDLMDGVRVSSSKFRLDRSTVSLRDVLDPVIEGLRPMLEERRQSLVLDLPTAAMRVCADPVRLAQIFSNLLDNASKYSARDGEIRLVLKSDGDSAALSVSDDGIGISAEAIPHIFDLFVQEGHAREHAGQGLGIGLAIVRELVQAHGGTISASSRGRGLGSRFLVTLPKLPAVPAVNAADAPAPAD